jgi:predicted oxidoreductase
MGGEGARRWHQGRIPAAALALASAVLLVGCLMPRRGTPVFVDARAGSFWSGEGLLLEVSPDQQRCRVAVRDRALLVKDRWVDCARVHPRRG